MDEKKDLTIQKDNFLPIEYLIVNGDLWRQIGPELTPFKKDMFTSLYGRSTLKKLPVYNKFELIPSHTNLQRKIKTPYGYNYNQFGGLSYKPKKGRWDNIHKILTHLGGDMYYQTLLEWLWLTYVHPEHKLVSLAFTGARKSGKTSFLKLCSALFEGGFIDADASLVTSNYNQLVAGKIILSVDEKIDGKEAAKELQTIKRNMSAKEININPKNKTPYTVRNFIRYIFNSNDGNKPFKLEQENERMLIIDVKRVRNGDERILKWMINEIPAFAYYLANEFEQEYAGSMVGSGNNRFWFPPSILQNSASARIQKESRPGIVEDVEELIRDFFYTANDDIDTLYIRAGTISKLLSGSNTGVKWVGSVLRDFINCEYKSSIRPAGNKYEVVKLRYDEFDIRSFRKPIGAWIFKREHFMPDEIDDEKKEKLDKIKNDIGSKSLEEEAIHLMHGDVKRKAYRSDNNY